MVTCADTSFLFSLYGNDVHSPQALDWVKSERFPITISIFGDFELANALRFAEYRKAIPQGAAALYWADFQADHKEGRIQISICNLAEVVDEAKELSATYTLTEGHRGFDILHVAAALAVSGKRFLTFDDNQRKLARATGMEVPL